MPSHMRRRAAEPRRYAAASLSSARLFLVPLTTALVKAEQAGSTSLAKLLGTVAPSSWPPELYEPDDLKRMERLLQDPQNHGWTLYYLLTQGDPVRLVGVAGFGGAPTAEGVVDLGYSVLPEFRRQGLATEAVEALITFAVADPRVRAIAAETYPALTASIGVLRKSGFRLVPSRPGSDTVRYERYVRASATTV